MSSDETSEHTSIRDGAGYNEVFGSGDEFGGFSHSSERETSDQSLNDDVESYAEENEEVVKEGEDKAKEGERESGSGKDEDDGDEESCEGTSRGPRDNYPFILPED